MGHENSSSPFAGLSDRDSATRWICAVHHAGASGQSQCQSTRNPWRIDQTHPRHDFLKRSIKKIRDLLAGDRKLISKIKQAARTHGIDPIHIIGALVGEHTYNVDAKDRLQSYYVKALAYLGQKLTFKYKRTTVTKLLKQPGFRPL